MPTNKTRDRERAHDRNPRRTHTRPRSRSRRRGYKSTKSDDSDSLWDEEERRHSRSSRSSLRSHPSARRKEKERRKVSIVTGRSSTPTSRSKSQRRSSMSGIETSSRPASASFLESRTSLPYPSFSKAHSKEAPGRRDIDILTPEPTDITLENGADPRKRADGTGSPRTDTNSKRQSTRNTRPPSPPLTNIDQQPTKKEKDSTTNGSKSGEGRRGSTKSHDEKRKTKARPTSMRSTSSLHRRSVDESNGKPPRPSTPVKQKVLDALQFSKTQHIPVRSRRSQRLDSPSGRREKSSSPINSTVTEADTITDSDATSIAPHQPTSFQKPAEMPRAKAKGVADVHEAAAPSPPSSRKQTPSNGFRQSGTPTSVGPPPPPPPPDMPASIPRVDYLLQNGGLSHHVPKNLLGAGESPIMPHCMLDPQRAALKLFEPYNKLLDEYNQVLMKRGSLAVATGYRSVARRLLDRLEAVFARDISSESCECLMCYPPDSPGEESEGVSWGDMLELVSGRRELPSWPPFNINSQPDRTEFSGSEGHVPMQKLDIDVPEEHREHYIRHSKKTKQAIDKWLSKQPELSSSPPHEVDDETLMFAMLTHLDKSQRATFSALLDIPMTPPVPKRETPKPRDRPEVLVRAGTALQRLYRLPHPPRDPESALYLLKNPEMHHVLATLAAISSDEWDILISGRFDGFLRSGAEDDVSQPAATAPPRSGSRKSSTTGVANSQDSRASSQPTHSSSSSTHAPASFGGPISIDEEQEIAVLSEVERDIYLGMEALEDAFEILHCKAEAVRRALRERGAGLTVASQARRGSLGGAEVFTTGPGATPGRSTSADPESLTDDWMDDGVSIAPSDSASNISSNRRRRPKRRTERRTPAAVEEEDEGDDDNEDHRDAGRHYHISASGRSRRR